MLHSILEGRVLANVVRPVSFQCSAGLRAEVALCAFTYYIPLPYCLVIPSSPPPPRLFAEAASLQKSDLQPDAVCLSLSNHTTSCFESFVTVFCNVCDQGPKVIVLGLGRDS